jgi:hypothetical protein
MLQALEAWQKKQRMLKESSKKRKRDRKQEEQDEGSRLKIGLSDRKLEALQLFIHSVMTKFVKKYCHASRVATVQTFEVSAQPLPEEMGAIFEQCAFESAKQYFEEVDVKQKLWSSVSLWSSVALAAVLNSLILGGFEEHCLVNLDQSFSNLMKVCPWCDATTVREYQIKLLEHNLFCKQLYNPKIRKDIH